MDFRITSTKSRNRVRTRGTTLVEFLVALGLGSLVLAAVALIFVSGKVSFVALGEYVDLDRMNRAAVDTMTREVRQVNRVTGYTVDTGTLTTNSLTFEDFDGAALTYAYSYGTKMLTRTKSGSSTVLLKNCDFVNFWLGQRTPTNGVYNVFPASDTAPAKLVDMTWRCAQSSFGRQATTNSENVMTARIVIRREH